MDKCIIEHVDKEKIDMLKKEIEDDEMILDIANIFSAMSDSNRAKILMLLIKQSLCVCDLEQLIGISQSSISHHLRILKNHKIVKFTKKGKRVYYSLDDNHIMDILNICKAHVEE